MSDVDLPHVITTVEGLQDVLDFFGPQPHNLPHPEIDGCRQMLGLDCETSPQEVAVKGTNDDGSPIYDEELNKKRGLSPFSNKLRTVQISDGILTCVIILDDMDPKALHVLQPLFDETLVLGVNLAFDGKMLLHHCGLTLPHVWDLGLAERCLGAGRYVSNSEWYHSSSLAGLARTYLGVELSKDIRDAFGTGQALTDDQILYSAKDAEILPRIYNKQRVAVEAEGLLRAAHVEMNAVAGIVELELTGMYVDPEQWLVLASRAEQRRRELYDDLQLAFIPKFYKDYFGEDVARSLGLKVFDPNSPLDTKKAFERLGLVIADCQEQSIATAMVDRPEFQPQLKILLEYKNYQKQATAFGKAWLEKHVNPITSKVHCHYDQYGALTARASCSQPNMQQIPSKGDEGKMYRKSFSVPKDSEQCIISVDWMGAEIRIMAWYSQDPVLLEAYNGDKPKDVHSVVAAMMFDIDYDVLMLGLETKDSDAVNQRATAKSISLGLPYGMGPKKLAATMNISMHRAKELFDIHRQKFPRLVSFLDRTAQDARKNWQVRGIAGHRRIFLPPNPSQLTNDEYRMKLGSVEREGKNFAFQNANAVWMKQALHEVPPLIRPYGFRLCHVVHDELVLVGHEWYAKEAAEVTRMKMIEIGEAWLCKTETRQAVRVNAEAKVAAHWSK